MNTFNRMFNNADVTGAPAGSWYEPKTTMPQRFTVRYAPKAPKTPALSGMGCCGGLGDGAFSLMPALFALIAPVAIGAVVLVAVRAFE